jgi:hypothetical protein
MPMVLLTLLDAVILAPAAALGLLGLWLGLGRSLVAWPMRWLIPLFGACLAALPTALSIAVNGGVAELISLFDVVAAAVVVAGAFCVVVTLVLLVMFMGNLRERMAVWTAGRRVGLLQRICGSAFGIACGLLLAALPLASLEAIWPNAGADRSWARDSVLLPHVMTAAAAARSALLSSLPPAAAKPRRELREAR